jgi:carbamoyl-phosphate synthase large subunit
MLSVGYRIPKKAVLISSGPIRSKLELLKSSKMLEERGYKLYGTRGTAKFLSEHGVTIEAVAWPDEDDQKNAVSLIRNREVDLVVNIPKNLSKDELNNDYEIRRTAIDLNVPLVTNARLASAFIYSICKKSEADLGIESFSEYVQKQDW